MILCLTQDLKSSIRYGLSSMGQCRFKCISLLCKCQSHLLGCVIQILCVQFFSIEPRAIFRVSSCKGPHELNFLVVQSVGVVINTTTMEGFKKNYISNKKTIFRFTIRALVMSARQRYILTSYKLFLGQTSITHQNCFVIEGLE